jgi:hypothetical protein
VTTPAVLAGPALEEAILAAYPVVAYLPDAEQVLAAKCGVTLAKVEAVLNSHGMLDRLEAARLSAEANGDTVIPLAKRIALKLLNRIYAEADEVDAFGAADLMKPINRILENAERVRLAEREKDDNSTLPIFNFIFSSGRMLAERVVDSPLAIIDLKVGSRSDSENGGQQ